MPSGKVELIQSDQELIELCQRLQNSTLLALDTEFERSRTFYVRPALLQVSNQLGVYLIDPLSINQLAPLIELLSGEHPKILHSASEDLEVFERLGVRALRPLFDTQIAASLLGYGYSLGYRALVENICRVKLAKGETRSNWLRRPLSPAQLEYAAQDVAFLPSLHEQLCTELENKGRGSWLIEECHRLTDKHGADRDPEYAYLRIEGASRLGRRELGVLRALCAWREHEARKRNQPRSFVVEDDVLLGISSRIPEDVPALLNILGRVYQEKERECQVLINIINRVMELDDHQLPPRRSAPRDLRPYAQLLKTLKKLVRDTADELQLAPEILAHRRALEGLVRRVLLEGNHELTPFFEGWRAAVIGHRLLAVLTEESQP